MLGGAARRPGGVLADVRRRRREEQDRRPGEAMRLTRFVPVALALVSIPSARAQSFWDPRPRHGGQATLGIGLIGASVSGGGASVDGASGRGMQLVIEVRLAERLAWDVRGGGFWTSLGAPAEIDYPADDGDYALLSTGLHYDLARGEAWSVWAGGEATLHYASMDEYFYSVSGIGVGPAFGADLVVAGPFTLRASAHLSWVSLENDYGDEVGTARVFSGGVDLLYVLR